MKKVSLLLLHVCAALLCVTAVACGSNNSQAGTDSAEQSGETVEESDDTADGLTIVPIVIQDYDSPIYASCNSGHYALMHGDRYVMFDNDDNYKEYCMLIDFLGGCERGLILKLRSKYQITEPWNAKYCKWDTTYTLEEINKLIIDARVKLVADVLRYVQGKKEQISDPEIFELIDRTYYDNHPFEQNFHLSNSRYNYKRYESQNRSVSAQPASEYCIDGRTIHGPYDSTPVPARTLLFD